MQAVVYMYSNFINFHTDFISILYFCCSNISRLVSDLDTTNIVDPDKMSRLQANSSGSYSTLCANTGVMATAAERVKILYM